jgi:CDP-6-deoxy-D-xylo-4-hexulose-3-dehydrase
VEKLKIPLVKSAFSNEEETKRALADFIVDAPILSMGEKCFEFEREFAKWQGRRHCVLYNSGSSANLALLQSLENINGDKWDRWLCGDRLNVGISACTFATNVMPILQLGFNPVPIDCKIPTLNTTADNLLDKILDKGHDGLEYLFITNLLGFAGDLNIIRKVCEEEQITLIEDNCESLGTELTSGKTGNFGLASTFSFFVAHQMSTIEGGAVCTDDAELAQMLKLVRAHGWDRNLSVDEQSALRKKHGVNNFRAHYTFYESAFNFRPTEITGFLGIEQLKHLDENIRRRAENYKLVSEIYESNPDFIPIESSHLSKISAFAIPILCKTPELRKKYVCNFIGAGIECRPMVGGNITKQPFYQKKYIHWQNYPGADFLDTCAFYCGNSPDYTTDELLTITKAMMK